VEKLDTHVIKAFTSVGRSERFSVSLLLALLGLMKDTPLLIMMVAMRMGVSAIVLCGKIVVRWLFLPLLHSGSTVCLQVRLAAMWLDA